MGEYILNSTLTAGECLRRLRDASDYDGFMGSAGTKMVLHRGDDRCLILRMRAISSSRVWLEANCYIRDSQAGAEIRVCVGLASGTRIHFAFLGVGFLLFLGLTSFTALRSGKVAFTSKGLAVSFMVGFAWLMAWTFRRDIRDAQWQEEFLIGFVKTQTHGPDTSQLATGTNQRGENVAGADPVKGGPPR